MLIMNEFRRGEVPRARTFMVTMRVKIDVDAFHERLSRVVANTTLPALYFMMRDWFRLFWFGVGVIMPWCGWSACPTDSDLAACTDAELRAAMQRGGLVRICCDQIVLTR